VNGPRLVGVFAAIPLAHFAVDVATCGTGEEGLRTRAGRRAAMAA
jgi:hypothetical protein